MKKHSFAIKVCGITRQSDLSTAMGMGAHFCGFIFHPGSPRYIAPSRAAALDSALIRRVGVFVNQNAEEIMDIMKTARLEFAQLHGAHSLDCARRIGPEKVIRVLWPDRYESVDALQREMELWADSCAWFLLDAGSQGGGHGVLGQHLADLGLGGLLQGGQTAVLGVDLLRVDDDLLGLGNGAGGLRKGRLGVPAAVQPGTGPHRPDHHTAAVRLIFRRHPEALGGGQGRKSMHCILLLFFV